MTAASQTPVPPSSNTPARLDGGVPAAHGHGHRRQESPTLGASTAAQGATGRLRGSGTKDGRARALSASTAGRGDADPTGDVGGLLRASSTGSGTGSCSSSRSTSPSSSSEGGSSGDEPRTAVAPGMLGPFSLGSWNTRGLLFGHRLEGPSMQLFRRRLRRIQRLLEQHMVVFLQETRATRAEAAILGSHFPGVEMHTTCGAGAAGRGVADHGVSGICSGVSSASILCHHPGSRVDFAMNE